MDTIPDIIIPFNSLSPTCYALGKSVGPAGDFNGDGIDDLAVGADGSVNPYDNKGYLYIFSGDSSYPTPAENEPELPIPQKYNILEQNYPNPFNSGTEIEYSLWGTYGREIELNIYNLLGQKIRTLYSGMQTGGTHIVYWDGLNDSGQDVASGIYFYKLTSNNEVISKKMILLK
jgi:FlgD Ig-like domain/FG-GAP repeat